MFLGEGAHLLVGEIVEPVAHAGPFPGHLHAFLFPFEDGQPQDAFGFEHAGQPGHYGRNLVVAHVDEGMIRPYPVDRLVGHVKFSQGMDGTLHSARGARMKGVFRVVHADDVQSHAGEESGVGVVAGTHVHDRAPAQVLHEKEGMGSDDLKEFLLEKFAKLVRTRDGNRLQISGSRGHRLFSSTEYA